VTTESVLQVAFAALGMTEKLHEGPSSRRLLLAIIVPLRFCACAQVALLDAPAGVVKWTPGRAQSAAPDNP
jgi:hypothetical protein